MITGWGYVPWSYNAGFWSVSVELVIYLIFYALTRIGGEKHFKSVSILMLIVFFSARFGKIPLGDFQRVLDCCLLFYAGGHIFLLYDILGERAQSLICIHFSGKYICHIENIIEKIGNLTYGVYLIQFPIQIFLALIFSTETVAEKNHLLFSLYIGLTYTCAFFIYANFEMPAQTYLRELLLEKFQTQKTIEIELLLPM